MSIGGQFVFQPLISIPNKSRKSDYSMPTYELPTPDTLGPAIEVDFVLNSNFFALAK